MLADEAEIQSYSGVLDPEVHLKGEWFDSLIEFIGAELPAWRDDPMRPSHSNENGLTSQLCSHLASVSRHTPGWDFLQFKREEPDEVGAGREIDLAVAPSGAVIWIEGRQYTKYQTLLPIECKRLPTPPGSKRDRREYIYSSFSSTGGIHRFKVGHHASAHVRAVMVAYIQEKDIRTWAKQLDRWIDELEMSLEGDWSLEDKLIMTSQDSVSKTALFRSTHMRGLGLKKIRIDHLWIEM
ncbi:hypothetical protein [Alloalcanivorax gelatiniphagus]|uniref:NERD domain-containing protein n=1 Tax=Alloalcanivorax gelatiniphagus TaxID=1194167 RepID=A0ABY2XQK6_9GAMM|nr:hypothetical protein [Alloalcanivorax gelatiniphagus]TMW15200.1 hypothetical protein FGS76_00060 [Alloalcanivorax gelatiniphagus]